jgi:predicted GNAT family acetyltransferase
MRVHAQSVGTATRTDYDNPVTVARINNSHKSEVLAYLNRRPLHTVVMSGLIRDNGVESPLNRGTFYTCRDQQGRLVGVTLIGEITMLETHTEPALAAFAHLTQETPNIYMIMGEEKKIGRFWKHYAGQGQPMRCFCREFLYKFDSPANESESVPNLRPATAEDLELVMQVHARMAFEESGINAQEADPEGFRQRCLRRIEQERVWVWIEKERMIFKADIISETPEVIYLEGVYVNPENRGRGHGRRCLSQLSRDLLRRTKSVCVLVNEQNRTAQDLYRKAHYQLRGRYTSVFLDRALPARA